MNRTTDLTIAHATPVREEDLPPADDPFFYGWRYVTQEVDGEERIVQVPLTLEDVLHPQEEDHVSQNLKHVDVCAYLYDSLRAYVRHEPDTVILHDVLIDWGVIDKGHSPDIAVIREVREVPTREYVGTFSLKTRGGRVDLVIEVTSPNTWRADVEGGRDPNKFIEYAQAGVPIYVIVLLYGNPYDQAPPIVAYWLNAQQHYEQIEPNEQGWVWIESVQLWLGAYEDRVAWYDEAGNRLESHIELADARKLAEDKAREEADARKLAEDKAREEADARKLAEDKARLAEDKAREEADARKLAEDKARLAEERIRELEALLQRAR